MNKDKYKGFFKDLFITHLVIIWFNLILFNIQIIFAIKKNSM